MGIWATYLKGHLVLALAIGGLTGVVNAGIGLEWPLALGVIAGLFEPIPTFGAMAAALPAVAVALWRGSSVIPVSSWVFALIVLGVYVLIQQIGVLVIEPRVMGARLHLPPLVVFLGVLAGAVIGGPIGALIAVPVIASVREVAVYLRR